MSDSIYPPEVEVTNQPGEDLDVSLGGAGNDSFGRLRTSDTGQRLDVEFLYDKQVDFFDEVTNNGTVTHNTTSRDLTLSIANASSGTHATMRSHPVPYTPGNSQLIDITGVLDLAGIGGGTPQVFLRSSITGSAVETVVDVDSWDVPQTDVDWTDSHIFAMDFQSLKVGTIRYFMVRNGTPTRVHSIHNDNTRNTGYWQLASLPAYWRIYNDATYTYMEAGYGDEANAIGFRYRISANASATMRAICCTVKSEGGDALKDMPGLARTINTGAASKTVADTQIPLLSIRPKTTFNSLPNIIPALPKLYSAQTDNPILVTVTLGGTLTGASWADVDASASMMEYDTSATALTGGRVVFSEYIATSKNTSGSGQGLLGKPVLWDRQGSETGILTISAVRTTSTSADVLASLEWEELR